MKEIEIKEFTFVKYGDEILFIFNIFKKCPQCNRIKLVTKRKYGHKYHWETDCFYLNEFKNINSSSQQRRLKKKFLEELLKE